MPKKKLVVTGACGYVVQRMWEALNARYDVVALDVTTKRRDGSEVAGVQVCDLTSDDRDSYRKHFMGADATLRLDRLTSNKS